MPPAILINGFRDRSRAVPCKCRGLRSELLSQAPEEQSTSRARTGLWNRGGGGPESRVCTIHHIVAAISMSEIDSTDVATVSHFEIPDVSIDRVPLKGEEESSSVFPRTKIVLRTDHFYAERVNS